MQQGFVNVLKCFGRTHFEICLKNEGEQTVAIDFLKAPRCGFVLRSENKTIFKEYILKILLACDQLDLAHINN